MFRSGLPAPFGSGGFEVKVDRNFEAIIDGCAAPRSGRRSTWINARIRSLYRELFALGHCHTIEVWQDGALTGGLYGVHLGRAFFGESMFSKARDASKIALVYLVARLIYGGFTLLDTQFVTGHLARFGAIEVSRDEFQRFLEAALGGGGGLAHGSGSGPASARLRLGGGGAGASAGAAGASAGCRIGTGGILAATGRRGRRIGLAVGQPDIEDRMLDGVKAGAFGEHPAGEDTLHLAGELHLVNLDEGCGVRLLGRRTGVAHPRRHFEGAELDGLVDGNLEMARCAP